MTQALEDMQTDLVKVRQSYAEVTASQRRMTKQRDEAEKLSKGEGVTFQDHRFHSKHSVSQHL